MYLYGIHHWQKMFNSRQIVTLANYVEIIKDAKSLIQAEYELEKAEAITIYLSLVLDRCADANCRLVIYNASRACIQKSSTQHTLNLMWNYPEVNGGNELWKACQEEAAQNYTSICELLGTKLGSTGIPGLEQHAPKSLKIDAASADSLTHISDQSLDVIVTDPPYYDSAISLR